MLIYHRYIAINVFLSVIVSALVITNFIWIIQVLKFLHYLSKNIGIIVFLKLIIQIIPSLLFITLPFANGISALYVYNKLHNDHQLNILRNAGLNNFNLAKPAIVVSIFITIFTYYISYSLLPNSHINLKKGLREIRNNHAISIINVKTFTQIGHSLTIYVKSKDDNGVLRGVIVLDNSDEKNLSIMFAKSGYLIFQNSTPMLHLEEGMRQGYDEQGNVRTLKFTVLDLSIANKYNINNQGKSDYNEYFIDELFNPDSSYSAERKLKLQAEGHQRILWPLFCFTLPFLGLAIVLRYPYNKKTNSLPMLLAVSSFILIIYIHLTLQNLISKAPELFILYYINILVANIIALCLYKQQKI